jgi:hypothetical protein
LGTLGLLASLPGVASALPNAASPMRALPHFRPRAKRVIHLFMNGGPFGPDFFDPKPDLTKFAGQRPEGADLRTERPTDGGCYARRGWLPSAFAGVGAEAEDRRWIRFGPIRENSVAAISASAWSLLVQNSTLKPEWTVFTA